jgi:hypothetical protein
MNSRQLLVRMTEEGRGVFSLAHSPVITHYPTDQILAFVPSFSRRRSLPRVHEQDKGAGKRLGDPSGRLKACFFNTLVQATRGYQ